MTPAARLDAAIAGMHDPWGGALCLDFANTLEPRGGPPPFAFPPGEPVRDELTSYAELVGWAVHKTAVPRAVGLALIADAETQPAAAAVVLARAHRLRDAIYRVFWAMAHGNAPDRADLAVLAEEHADGAAHAELVATVTTADWQWPDRAPALARPLWPVAWSATTLLITGEPARMKVCPGAPAQTPTCAWLFYDATKNRSRRWCNMIDCGDVTKAKRQTARRRALRASGKSATGD